MEAALGNTEPAPIRAIRTGTLVDERPVESPWRFRALWFLLGFCLGLVLLVLAIWRMEQQLSVMERRIAPSPSYPAKEIR